MAEIKALPHGILLMIPVAQGQTMGGLMLEYNGVVPDIAVTLDRILPLGIDPLQAAIQYLPENES